MASDGLSRIHWLTWLMAHDHAHHSAHHHTHEPRGHSRAARTDRRLLWALLLTAAFTLIEAAGGWLAHSLALLADAGHMLTDVLSLSLAFLALRASAKSADARRTYGYQRYQVLAAFVNGLLLLAISIWILFEAALRLLSPAPVLAGLMLWIALAGLAVNLVAYFLLHGAHDNLNTRAAMAHVLGDMLGSVAALLAAAVILATGWTPADPLLSALVAALLLRTGFRLTKQSGHVLLEGSPEHLDLSGLEAEMTAAVPELTSVHHVHAWSLTPEQPMMTLHAVVGEQADGDHVVGAIGAFLKARYGVTHVTVQVERASCDAPCA
jgi:cobalt-zinc-cadmium efflux system protein